MSKNLFDAPTEEAVQGALWFSLQTWNSHEPITKALAECFSVMFVLRHGQRPTQEGFRATLNEFSNSLTDPVLSALLSTPQATEDDKNTLLNMDKSNFVTFLLKQGYGK